MSPRSTVLYGKLNLPHFLFLPLSLWSIILYEGLQFYNFFLLPLSAWSRVLYVELTVSAAQLVNGTPEFLCGFYELAMTLCRESDGWSPKFHVSIFNISLNTGLPSVPRSRKWHINIRILLLNCLVYSSLLSCLLHATFSLICWQLRYPIRINIIT
jgi:hypothetical protein